MDPTNSDDEEEHIPLSILVPALIIITIMIVLAVGGNLLVIIAYLKDRKLHNPHNLYIFHLAITDFLLGAISMPFYAVYTALFWAWPFGKTFCKVYMVMDFTLCLQSVVLIIIVSLDRLILVKSGAQYNVSETQKKARIKVSLAWVYSFVLYGPAIIGYDIWIGRSSVEDGDCNVEFYTDFVFTVTTSSIEFLVPFVSIAVINALVYYKIRKRHRVRHGEVAKKAIPVDQSDQTDKKPKIGEHTALVSIATVTSDYTITAQSTKNREQKLKTKKLQKDLKAARALAILVVALMICWLPYTAATIIIAFCPSCISEDFYEFMNWLLWSKASINPFLYAFNSERFRENFVRIVPILRYPLKVKHRVY